MRNKVWVGLGDAGGDFVRVGGGSGVWVSGLGWVAVREVSGLGQVCVCLGPSLPTGMPRV